MAPKVDPIPSFSQAPARATVVVIGGGIIGVAAALFLARRRVEVVLCEKGTIAGEQSSRNWGWCRKMGRDPAELPLAIESLRLWAEMDQFTRADTGFRRSGIVYLCATEKQLAKYEAWLGRAAAYQVDSRIVRGVEVDQVLSGLAGRWAGVLVTSSDGRAEPQKATSAMAAAAIRDGATILQRCAVRGIETEAGRVAEVITEQGRIRCQAVILAGGAWSRLFCGNLGIDLPQLKVLASAMRTEPLSGPPEIAVGGADFAFRKRLDGGYTVAHRGASVAEIVPDSLRLFFDFLPALKAQWHELRLRVGRRFLEEWTMPTRWPLDAVTPFERVRVLDPKPSMRILDQAGRNLIRAFPAFARMRIAERWAGLIDATPDALPVISPVEALPGFFLATGFSGHGFGSGPAAGRLIADLVTGTDPLVDPRPFGIGRFARSAKFKAA